MSLVRRILSHAHQNFLSFYSLNHMTGRRILYRLDSRMLPIVRHSSTSCEDSYNPPNNCLNDHIVHRAQNRKRKSECRSEPNIKLPSPAEGSFYEQIVALQRQYAKHIVLLRVGDFYELYGKQAETIGTLLDLTVTSKVLSGRRIAMAGFPCVSYDTYMARLIKKNKTVAVVEQVHPPAPRKRPTLLKRKCIRIVTPGTLLTETYLNPSGGNFLLALSINKPISFDDIGNLPIGMSWADLSTGKVVTKLSTFECLAGDLLRIHPVEILISNEILNYDGWAKSNENPILNVIYRALGTEILVVPLPEQDFKPSEISSRIIDKYFTDFQFKLQDNESNFASSNTRSVSDVNDHLIYQAFSGILSYIDYTLFDAKPILHEPVFQCNKDHMFLDDTSFKQLEIYKTFLRGSRVGSLVGFLSVAKTPMGRREIIERAASPSINLQVIQQRHDYVDFFHRNHLLIAKLEREFKNVIDIERCLQKMSVGVAKYVDTLDFYTSLKTFLFIQDSLQDILDCEPHIQEEKSMLSLQILIKRLSDHTKLIQELEKNLNLEGLSLQIDFAADAFVARKRLIRERVDVQLDTMYERYVHALRKLQVSKDIVIHDFELKSAKFSLTSVDGPMIEMSKVDSTQLVDLMQTMDISEDWRCIKKTKSKHCWYFKRWEEHARELLEINDQIDHRERMLLSCLHKQILGKRRDIEQSVSAIVELDIASSFAKLAVENGLRRPAMHNGTASRITKGWHPIGHLSQAKRGMEYIRNNCELDPSFAATWLITGPNMGGKSTFLKQVALIHIMAQIGSFVPAAEATLGIVDAILTRLGSHDDLWLHLSTFGVEMRDLAKMIAYATPKSLLIIDELGRGTSMEDATALSLSIMQHFVTTINCRMLVSSHQHEVPRLIEQLFERNIRRKIRFWHTKPVGGDEFSMNYELLPGVAESSFGIEIARFAGLPARVIDNAKGFRERVKQLRLNQLNVK